MTDKLDKLNTQIDLKDLEKVKDIPTIFSREEIIKDNPFPVIDSQKLEKIAVELKEANRKIQFLSHQDTQTTRKLMTLQMLQTADSTYRVLRQILATVERRQQAIAEAYANLKVQYAKILKYKRQYEQTDDEIERLRLEGLIEKTKAGMSNSISYLENAIKEVGYLLDTYNDIKKNKNIPDDWDEYDVEMDEIKSHIRSAFRNAIRDHLVHGAIGMGTCEYFEQFGISPIEASFHVKEYLMRCNEKLQKAHGKLPEQIVNELPDYDDFHDFLNRMAEIYKDHYKKACKRLGINELYTLDFLLVAERNIAKIKEKYNMDDIDKSIK